MAHVSYEDILDSSRKNNQQTRKKAYHTIRSSIVLLFSLPIQQPRFVVFKVVEFPNSGGVVCVCVCESYKKSVMAGLETQ